MNIFKKTIQTQSINPLPTEPKNNPQPDQSRKIRVTEVKPDIETFAKIKVIGIGGSGGSALNRMVEAKIRGVDFLAINTDAQALQNNKSPIKIHIGRSATKGLGAGMNPDLGRKAAEENQTEIVERLTGADMIFITCGLGGGTGTGAAPIIASIAREIGALTIAVVTKPFAFEGAQRKAIADVGFEELAKKVDAIITIPNDRLLQVIDKKTSLLDAFAIVDEVLKQGVQGISELITVPGLINVDFADVKAIMQNAGSALMGIGRGTGENRAVEAAKAAIDSPLLELSIDGAKGVLFTISGGKDLSMYEVAEAAQIITKTSDPDAKVIFGAVIDPSLGDEIKITVVATGFAGGAPIFKTEADREKERIIPGQNMPSRFGVVDNSTKTSASPSASLSRQSTSKRDDLLIENDSELEIPAFIRKKMDV